MGGHGGLCTQGQREGCVSAWPYEGLGRCPPDVSFTPHGFLFILSPCLRFWSIRGKLAISRPVKWCLPKAALGRIPPQALVDPLGGGRGSPNAPPRGSPRDPPGRAPEIPQGVPQGTSRGTLGGPLGNLLPPPRDPLGDPLGDRPGEPSGDPGIPNPWRIPRGIPPGPLGDPPGAHQGDPPGNPQGGALAPSAWDGGDAWGGRTRRSEGG